MSEPLTVTLLGAGGKMGGRVTANLRNLSRYRIDYVEASEERRKEMAAGGIETTPLQEALDRADAVILAVPDRLIARITQDVVPKLKPGTIVVGLDPAAAYAEIMPKREDITYFVAHPCHPPLVFRLRAGFGRHRLVRREGSVATKRGLRAASGTRRTLYDRRNPCSRHVRADPQTA